MAASKLVFQHLQEKERERSMKRFKVIRPMYRVKREKIQILRVVPGIRDLDAILEEGFPDEEN